MDLRERRELNRGFGEALSRAFEFAAAPAIFGGLGYLADGALGTQPIFTIFAVVFAFVGATVRFWYGYDAEMKAREAAGAWNAKPAPVETQP